MTKAILLIISAWVVLLVGAAVVVQRLLVAQRSRRRLLREDGPAVDLSATPVPAGAEPRALARFLSLAGYRSAAAPAVFIVLTCAGLLAGGAIAAVVTWSGAIDRVLALIDAVPGNALDVFLPVFYALPWLIVVGLALLPFSVVRRARRERVQKVEQDLPITLELLATLAESGIGFDAALDRVLSGEDPTRPLPTELRTFRAETLSGRPRVSSFRRLARRVDVTSFSTFVSAVVQAEQVGAGIATVLRRQADDVRDRRRERAMEAAMALPVKRLVPLAVCFMPGIFVWSLGPSFFEFFRFVNVFTQHGGAR